MPYPFTTAGGGIASVSWGDITGTVADQTDLNTVLEDLQDRVAALEAGSLEWLDATDNTFWVPGGSYLYTWDTDHWVGATEEDEPSFPRRLEKTGGWVTDYRPTAARVTINSGPEPTYAGDYAGPMSVVIKDGFGSGLGGVYDVEFTAWDQDLVVDIETLTFSGTGIGTDIDRLEVYSTTRSVGPLIKKIEFLPTP